MNAITQIFTDFNEGEICRLVLNVEAFVGRHVIERSVDLFTSLVVTHIREARGDVEVTLQLVATVDMQFEFGEALVDVIVRPWREATVAVREVDATRFAVDLGCRLDVPLCVTEDDASQRPVGVETVVAVVAVGIVVEVATGLVEAGEWLSHG